MKNVINSLDATPLRAATTFSFFYVLLASLCLLFMMSCNTQKATADAADKSAQQRPARQGQRGGPPSVAEVFKLDANGDGKLAKSEVTGRLAEDFARFDSNADGFITKAEFENAPKPQRRPGGGQRQ